MSSGSVSVFSKVRIHIGNAVCVLVLLSTVVRFNCLTCSIGKFKFCNSVLISVSVIVCGRPFSVRLSVLFLSVA